MLRCGVQVEGLGNQHFFCRGAVNKKSMDYRLTKQEVLNTQSPQVDHCTFIDQSEAQIIISQ